MENQLEKDMEHEMDTSVRVKWGLHGDTIPQKWSIKLKRKWNGSRARVGAFQGLCNVGGRNHNQYHLKVCPFTTAYQGSIPLGEYGEHL